jgi:LPXTG-motif cell wall-anchored protein
MKMLRSARLGVFVVFAATFTMALAAPAWTQVRARGGVRVINAVDCPQGGNAPNVSVPFSIEITGLLPFAQDAEMFVTDMDASPAVQYGPIIIQDVDGNGRACMNVFTAPPGMWKIDVVEQGEGFTDSKVITVLGPEPTTTASTTAPPPPPPPTSTTSTTEPEESTTTEPEESTTTSSTTTSSTTTSSTTATSTTVPSTSPTTVPSPTTSTSPATIQRPGSELPWTFVFVAAEETAPSELPRTGSDHTAPLVLVGVAFLGAGVPLFFARRRR